MTSLLGKFPIIPLTCTEILQRVVFCLRSHLLAPAISEGKKKKSTLGFWVKREILFYILIFVGVPLMNKKEMKGRNIIKNKREAMQTFV